MTISTLIAPAPTEQWKVKRPKPVEYPDSDGKPMADNTKQFRYIVTIKEGLDDLFRADPNVFVAGDLLWYPQEGEPKIRQAPDAMVVFGRPKGDRGSYMQWREEGIAPQVVFEVLSPHNTRREMEKKRLFYEQYGVDEYYIYDPDRGRLTGWLRREGRFEEIKPMQGWVSPRLGIKLELIGLELYLYQPNGKRILSYQELAAEVKAIAKDTALLRAETQVIIESAARQQAEARIAELEAKLRQLTGAA